MAYLLVFLTSALMASAFQPAGLPSFLDSSVSDYLSEAPTKPIGAEISDDDASKNTGCGTSTVSMLDCEGLKKKPRSECNKEEPKSEQCTELKTYYECLIVVKSRQIESFVTKLKSKTATEILSAVSDAKGNVRKAKVEALKQIKVKVELEGANATSSPATANATSSPVTANATSSPATANATSSPATANATSAPANAKAKFFLLEKNSTTATATALAPNSTKASNSSGFNTTKPKPVKKIPAQARIELAVKNAVEGALANNTKFAKQRVRSFVNKQSKQFEEKFAASVKTLLNNYVKDTHATAKDPDFLRFKCLLTEAHDLVKGVKATPLKDSLKAANRTVAEVQKEGKSKEKKEGDQK